MSANNASGTNPTPSPSTPSGGSASDKSHLPKQSSNRMAIVAVVVIVIIVIAVVGAGAALGWFSTKSSSPGTCPAGSGRDDRRRRLDPRAAPDDPLGEPVHLRPAELQRCGQRRGRHGPQPEDRRLRRLGRAALQHPGERAAVGLDRPHDPRARRGGRHHLRHLGRLEGPQPDRERARGDLPRHDHELGQLGDHVAQPGLEAPEREHHGRRAGRLERHHVRLHELALAGEHHLEVLGRRGNDGRVADGHQGERVPRRRGDGQVRPELDRVRRPRLRDHERPRVRCDPEPGEQLHPAERDEHRGGGGPGLEPPGGERRGRLGLGLDPEHAGGDDLPARDVLLRDGLLRPRGRVRLQRVAGPRAGDRGVPLVGRDDRAVGTRRDCRTSRCQRTWSARTRPRSAASPTTGMR